MWGSPQELRERRRWPGPASQLCRLRRVRPPRDLGNAGPAQGGHVIGRVVAAMD